mmetsp:Transcript_92322/g.288922  ORF Transcript_92322/g.288922 Transcript_92322/m.288922 type:complete len:344 (+) Transcript_92322:134-1165(+)
MLQVAALLGLSGEVRLEVAMKEEAKVLELKEYIAHQLHVPVLFQALVLGHVVLRDEEPLAMHHPGDGQVLVVTIMVCFDSAQRCLHAGSEAQKTKVLRALVERGLVGDVRLQMAAAALEDHSKDVRETAVQVLALFGAEDYRGTVSQVASRLESPYDDVRSAAAQALMEVARRGDDQTLASLRPHLDDPSADVREMAMAAFGEMAPIGDEDAIAIVLEHVHDRAMDVRWRALEALGKLVTVKGNRRLISTVIECLGMHSHYVRRWAVEVLGKVAERGDKLAIDDVIAYMDHSDEHVRMAAGVALGEIAEKGDMFAIEGLTRFLSHPNPGVRLAAILARRPLLR